MEPPLESGEQRAESRPGHPIRPAEDGAPGHQTDEKQEGQRQETSPGNRDRRVTRPEMACSGNAWHGEGSVSDSAPDPSPLSSPSSGARMSPVTLHKGASQAPSPVCLQPVIVDQAPGTRHQVFLSPPCQSQQTLKDKSSRNPVTVCCVDFRSVDV